MPGLDEYMAKKLNLEVRTLGILDNPRFSYGGTDDPGTGMELSVASGLALRAYPKAA